MINYNIKKYFIFVLIITFFVPNYNNAKEILIYADNISYDDDENIIARGNAKVFRNNQYIFSDLIIYEKKNNIIKLPKTFTFKDDQNNYFMGSSGFFKRDLNYAEINDVKIKLNDGSRIVGNKVKRDEHIDIISKGVYTPCKSRIKIANFICPTWQLEGEKILHDNKNLFLYQKHSKMRVINTPVFYTPYIVTPSPLRKDRKSGFLTPSLALNFLDTKTSQSVSLPYYFNLAIDKELTFTPIINYGGGVDSSQRFIFDYNQILSGGRLSTDLTFDSNLERQNYNKWFSDASLITKFNKNINENYKLSINSALETSKSYIQIVNPNDDLSYTNSLTSSVTLEGYNLNKIDDYLNINTKFYLTNQENEDNKTTPTVLPNIKYYSGNKIIKGNNVNNLYEFYNIFRDKHTEIHAKNQQKLSHTFRTSKEIIKYKSKINFQSETYNQFFETESKLINNDQYHSGNYYRLFPIFGISIKTPFKLNDRNSFTIEPNSQIVLSPGLSNSNKLSNEDSSNNNFTIGNISSLNRFSGSDKMDNSKRVKYGINIYNDFWKFNLSQMYEFTDNSNFHIESGNDDNLSDLLGLLEYNNNDKSKISYNFRYDFDNSLLKKQNIDFRSENKIGNYTISYLDEKSISNNIITNDTETINYKFNSKKFTKYSKINFSGLYDLKKEINTEYTIGYNYFDECFGINIDFTRKSYEEDNLKPQDKLTLMFSFKNIGSYKSTNLAVSEKEKQDIEWETGDVDNELFDDN